MRRLVRFGLVVQLLCLSSALWAAGAGAEPGSGPRATVDQSFTTKRTKEPTGINFHGRFHAAGDEQGTPPFLRQMVFYPPPGMRYRTDVPDQCSASDAELAVQGPAACPPGSRLGDGFTEGHVLSPGADGIVFDHYVHPVHILNNANEQIVLVESEGFTVVRGKFRPDGAIAWELPTCFPTIPATGCADDHLIQLATWSVLPPYTKTSPDGRVLSYATTPRRCPARGYWRTTVEFSWSDGSVDDVVTTQPCRVRKGPRLNSPRG